jgi:hypothetical protein
MTLRSPSGSWLIFAAKIDYLSQKPRFGEQTTLWFQVRPDWYVLGKQQT